MISSTTINTSNNSSIITNNNTNNNNNTTTTINETPLKQIYKRPLRSFIGSTSNGDSGVGGCSTIDSDINMSVKRLGHREVKHGIVHYKKVPTDELKKSIQLGIVHSIGVSNKYQDRDLLMHDFQTVETIVFGKGGKNAIPTPAHTFNDFKLKVYAPYGFKYFRKKFNVDEADYMASISQTELKEISNPGASGSVFYRTSDDKYILKTVQYQECAFLRTLLAGIYLNLLQNLINNKCSLLPTIYGLYCYQSDKTNIRVVVMNNILPSNIKMHEKYDLKGSQYKRRAGSKERAKSNPTYKDLDFIEEHPDGIILEEKHYDSVHSSLKRDCLILKSFGIMDYSLLLGIHKVDRDPSSPSISDLADLNTASATPLSFGSPTDLKQNKPNKFFNISAVPARSAKGENLLLFMGIIDILQSYRFKKRLEHTFKSIIADGNQISVCHPDYYESRFIDFITNKVLRKATKDPIQTVQNISQK